jgi:HEPN domain-containing protein
LKDVPDTVVEDVEIKMPDAMMKQYRAFEKELVLQLGTKNITAANAAALVTKLLQFTSGAVYDEDRKTHDIHDLKIEALRKLKKSIKSPILVACIFQHEQERIRKAFPDARFFADAKTEAQQLMLLEQWNERKIPMLVAHPASVGHGLNLQRGSSTMVWMSLTYSRELYEQMIARLSRRGQQDVVMVYRLMCPDTADDAVATVLQEKRDTEQRLLSALMLLEAVREDAKLSERVTKVVDNTATVGEGGGL